ncbi:MAG: membrane dipeptidase, partial [Pseudomonadales bacterium]
MKPLLVLIIAVLMNTSLSIADTLDARVSAVLRQTPLIDGHNDLPWQFKRRANNQLSAIDIGQNLSRSENPLHTDIPRLRAGMVGGLFWSVYVPIETYGGSAIAVQQVIDQIDLVYRRSIVSELLEKVDEVGDFLESYRKKAVCVVNPFSAALASTQM